MSSQSVQVVAGDITSVLDGFSQKRKSIPSPTYKLFIDLSKRCWRSGLDHRSLSKNHYVTELEIVFYPLSSSDVSFMFTCLVINTELLFDFTNL